MRVFYFVVNRKQKDILKLSFYQLNAHEIYFPFLFLDYYSNVVILKSSALFSVTYFGTALTTNTVRKAETGIVSEIPSEFGEFTNFQSVPRANYSFQIHCYCNFSSDFAKCESK